MRVVIAGSRSVTDVEAVRGAMNAAGYTRGMVKEVVSGGARGVDQAGERLAWECRLT